MQQNSMNPNYLAGALCVIAGFMMLYQCYKIILQKNDIPFSHYDAFFW